MMHQRPLSLQLTLTIMRAVKRNGKLNVLYTKRLSNTKYDNREMD